MKVFEEIPNALPRQREVVDYERAALGTLAQSWERLNRWFASETVMVGRGANHVFVSLRDPDKCLNHRVLLITRV